MSFDANADFVSLAASTKATGQDTRSSSSKKSSKDDNDGSSKKKKDKDKEKHRKYPKSLYRKRTKEKKNRMRDRVALRKAAREEYKRLAQHLAKAHEAMDSRAATIVGEEEGEEEHAQQQQQQHTNQRKTKKKKGRFDVEAIPAMLEQASRVPGFVPPSMTAEEMQEHLLTGSEKRAIKREQRESEEREKQLIKKQKKRDKLRMRQAEKLAQESGDNPGFVIDTTGNSA